MKFLRILAALAALLFVTSPAAAQWQVANGAIPLGRGAGAQGFGVVAGSAGAGQQCVKDTVPPTFGPCGSQAGAAGTVGYALISNGPTAAATFQGFQAYQSLVGDVRTWVAKAQDTFSVLDYAKGRGCVADGVADCTAAINAAIQAVTDYTVDGILGPSATVYVPQGPKCYRITSTVILQKNISLRGDGKGSCILVSSGNGITLNYVQGFGQPTISDLLIKGAGPDAGQTAIVVPGTDNWNDQLYGLNIRNVLIYDFDTGVSLKSALTNWITNLFIQNTKHCVTLIGWTSINRIQGLECVAGTTGTTSGLQLLQFNYTTGGLLSPEGTEVQQSQFIGFATGVDIQGAGFFAMSNSDVSATVDGIKATNVFGGLFINNNYIALTGAAGAHAIYLPGTTGTTENISNIYSNTLVSSGFGAGIQINDVASFGNTNVNVSKNLTSGFATHDLQAYGAFQFNVEDNWFKSTGTTDSINFGGAAGGVSMITNNTTAKAIVAVGADITAGVVRKCNNYVAGVREACTWGVETNAVTAGQVMVSGGGGVQPTGVSKSTTVNGVTCTLGSTCTVSGSAGGSSGQVQYNNAGSLGGFTIGGDATLNTATGVLTLATVNSNTGAIGSATQCVTVTNNAKGLTTAVTAATCTPAIGSITGLGTGVATALSATANAVGGVVTFNGTMGTPDIGTPSAGVGTNLTALNATQLTTGTVPNARLNATGAPAQIGAVASVKKQVFTASGTYTPAAGMLYAVIECVGGGGGGGGAAGTVGSIYGGGGGGSGSYSRLTVTAATVGAPKAVTIGAAGTAGATGANAGGAGGDTSVGTLCIGKGGAAGTGGSSSGASAGGAGGVAGTGDLAAAGNSGTSGVSNSALNPILPSGAGAPSFFGGAAPGVSNASTIAGVAAGNYASGGSGGFAYNTASTAAGGAGSAGVVHITEYCNQ